VVGGGQGVFRKKGVALLKGKGGRRERYFLYGVSCKLGTGDILRQKGYVSDLGNLGVVAWVKGDGNFQPGDLVREFVWGENKEAFAGASGSCPCVGKIKGKKKCVGGEGSFPLQLGLGPRCVAKLTFVVGEAGDQEGPGDFSSVGTCCRSWWG